MNSINATNIKNCLGVRERQSHKGDYGKVLLIAGSVGMAGAAVLAARGAYASGAGLVVGALPERLYPIMQISVPEAICIPRKTGKIDYSMYDSIVIGPGLGVEREVGNLLNELLLSYQGPVVIDADGLNVIVKYDLYQSLLDTKAQIVITPHPGEAKRLLGVANSDDRESMADSLARAFRVTAVLKGAGTLVATNQPDGQPVMHINTTGNPGMATAGSGDVLSGVIGAFLARGIKPFDAASAGVYVHGEAGDLAAREMGETGMVASDICRHIPYAIRNIIDK
jgi:ADP-dependent NAD(P)H-hydrate dehydratase / NAD(P)H-hydrate epimerase